MSRAGSSYFPALDATLPDMQGKVVAITGCTSGTGMVLAQVCARKGATVAMLNRSSERAQRALQLVQSCANNPALVIGIPCDLGSFDSVRKAGTQLAEHFGESGVFALANNAGVMCMNDVATVDGCDIQMQTNHLSHFLLTSEIFPLIELAAQKHGEARVINHSSIARTWARGRIDPRYLGKNGGNLGGDNPPGFGGPSAVRYGQSKLANVAFTYALREKLQASRSKVKALVCHPGVCDTSLLGSSDQLSGGMNSASAEDGACGIVKCCCLAGIPSGSFYGPVDNGGFSGEAVLLPRDTLSQASLSSLWQESEISTGCSFAL